MPRGWQFGVRFSDRTAAGSLTRYCQPAGSEGTGDGGRGTRSPAHGGRQRQAMGRRRRRRGVAAPNGGLDRGQGGPSISQGTGRADLCRGRGADGGDCNMVRPGRGDDEEFDEDGRVAGRVAGRGSMDGGRWTGSTDGSLAESRRAAQRPLRATWPPRLVGRRAPGGRAGRRIHKSLESLSST